MTRLRDGAVALVLVGLRLVLRVLSAVVPTTRSVVVSAYPETEGNGVETARALLEAYDGRVVWLRDAGSVPDDVRALADRGMVLVAKASLRGLVAYLRAETVFFTHGLYGSPRPVRRKPLVNLWHGDGPKDVRPGRGTGGLIASTWFVGSTRLFSTHQAAAFGVPEDQVLLTGNPRTDQLAEPVDGDDLTRLGVTGDFVLWMPTFRRARSVGAMPAHDESGGVAGEDHAPDHADALLAGLTARGIQLVVKPHPMDADDRELPGAVTLTDADLAVAGTTLYRLLGAARGLVTDYSSVWVDFLLLDRPVAFLVPDRDTYTRGLVPADVLDWVPGEVVGEDEPFAEFLADLDAGGQLGSAERVSVADRIGLVPTRTSAADLLDALAERGVLSTSRRPRRNGLSRNR